MVLTPSKKSIFDYNLLWPALVWGTGNYMTYIDDNNSQQFLTLSEFLCLVYRTSKVYSSCTENFLILFTDDLI